MSSSGYASEHITKASTGCQRPVQSLAVIKHQPQALQQASDEAHTLPLESG